MTDPTPPESDGRPELVERLRTTAGWVQAVIPPPGTFHHETILAAIDALSVPAAPVPATPADERPVAVSRDLLESLVDPDECWFDHHGGCQAHGYLSLEPGELCPHAEAKTLLAAAPPAAPPRDKPSDPAADTWFDAIEPDLLAASRPTCTDNETGANDE